MSASRKGHHGKTSGLPPATKLLATPSRASSPGGSSTSSPSRVASPMKRFHYPSRWSDWCENPRDKAFSLRRPGPVPNESDLTTNTPNPSLLEALGMSPLPSGTTDSLLPSSPPRARRPFLPACAPENLEHCKDDCYWQWLVHTLSDEMELLRETLHIAQEEYDQRLAQRRDTEHAIGNRNFAVDEVLSMTKASTKLHAEVPKLRMEHERLLQEADMVQKRSEELEAKQKELKEALEECLDAQDVTSRELQMKELEAEDAKKFKTELLEQITTAKEEFAQRAASVEHMRERIDEIEAQNAEMEEAKKPSGKRGKK